jgi:pimeloyl-ACP methyl ester carboxylesterase
MRSSDERLYGRVNAHVLTVDRPGYGRSSVDPDRTVASAAADALAVADSLGWDHFSVLGVSGGGPHALALGASAPERIHKLGIAVGATPPDQVNPDDLIAINREARRRILEEGRASLEQFLTESAAQAAADPIAMLDAAMTDAPSVDRELLQQPELRVMLATSLREAFINGPQGWFDDAWALGNPWGFNLTDVTVPVHMWYGELDRNVPLAAVKTMATQLTVASLEVIRAAGHLGWLKQEASVLDTLLNHSTDEG